MLRSTHAAPLFTHVRVLARRSRVGLHDGVTGPRALRPAGPAGPASSGLQLWLTLLFLAAAAPPWLARGEGDGAAPTPGAPPQHVSTCERSSRGGPSLFAADAPPLRLEIVQCNTASLPPRSALDGVTPDRWNKDLSTPLSAYLNAAYAALHGYNYTFFQVQGGFPAYNTWCRVAAVRQAAARQPPPEAILYLDGDSFIMTDLPMTLAELHGRTRAIGLDAGSIDIAWKDSVYQARHPRGAAFKADGERMRHDARRVTTHACIARRPRWDGNQRTRRAPRRSQPRAAPRSAGRT